MRVCLDSHLSGFKATGVCVRKLTLQDMWHVEFMCVRVRVCQGK